MSKCKFAGKEITGFTQECLYNSLTHIGIIQVPKENCYTECAKYKPVNPIITAVGPVTAEQMEPMSVKDLNAMLNAEEQESTFSPLEQETMREQFPNLALSFGLDKDPNGVDQHDGGAKLDAWCRPT